MQMTQKAMDMASAFGANRVTNPNQSEVFTNRLYDYQLYPTAGQGQFTFFSLPIGQGITSAQGATVGTSKTYADTNMVAANMLPSGLQFMIESVEVLFTPGSVSTANTYTPANPSVSGAAIGFAITAQLNDVNTFYQSGWLELNILQKNYLRETPMLCFPPKCSLDINSGLASNSATAVALANVWGKAVGRPYFLEAPLPLLPAVNFEVAIKYPGAVATPSGFNARVGVILDGYFMRASQ